MAVEDLYAKACDAVERANFPYAVRLLRDVLREKPDHIEARRLLRVAERRVSEGKKSFLTAALSPCSMLWTGLRALVAKPRARLELYEDRLEKRPSSFSALVGGAGAAAAAGLFEPAADMYKDALQLKPNNKRALRRIADMLKQSGNNTDAVKYLSRLHSLKPKDRDLANELRDLQATDHMVTHRMDDAASFRDLIRDKEQAERLEDSHRMAVTMDDLIAEIEVLRKRLAEEPGHVNRILRLAQLFQDTKQLAEARKLLKEKLELLPDNYDIREKLGDVELAMYDRAIVAAEQALEADPDNEEARAKKERLQRNRAAYGLQEYRWRLGEHPTDRALQLRLGQFYFDAGQYNEAIAASQAVTQDARYAARAVKLLGLSFMRKGQHDLALEQFARAIADHPEMDEEGKELRYEQAAAYEALGNTQEAVKIYKKVYSQDINFRDVARKVEALGK